MDPIAVRKCPNCGAPASPTHTLMQCEFCAAPLMVVKEPAAPLPMHVVMPMPPHAYTPPARSNPALFAVVLVAMLMLAGALAAGFLMRSSEAPPSPTPPPPDIVTTPPATAAPTVKPAGDVPADQAIGITAMFDAQCNAGNAQSCIALGSLYEQGSVVAQDKAKARFYYDKACKLGNSAGCTMAKK